MYRNIPSCYYVNYLNKVDKIMLPSTCAYKNVLPPIKNPTLTEMEKNNSVPKKKSKCNLECVIKVIFIYFNTLILKIKNVYFNISHFIIFFHLLIPLS